MFPIGELRFYKTIFVSSFLFFIPRTIRLPILNIG